MKLTKIIKKFLYFFLFFLLVFSTNSLTYGYTPQESNEIYFFNNTDKNFYDASLLPNEDFQLVICDFVIGRIFNVTREDKYISFETINCRIFIIHFLNGQLDQFHHFHYRRGYSVYFHNFDRFIGILTPHFICGIIYASYDIE
jgi:hypothetical protein